MADIKIKSPEGRIIEASEKAFEMIYKGLGFVMFEGQAARDKGQEKKAELTYEALKKLKKAELVAIAESRDVSVTPDAMTNAQIIEAVLSAGKEE